MKKYKQLFLGVMIGALLFGVAPAIADITTYIAELANFPVVVDGTPITLDKPIITIDGSTYLPLRALGDVLGVKVDWNEEKQQAEIQKGGNKVTEVKGEINVVGTTDDGIDVVEYNGEKYVPAWIVARINNWALIIVEEKNGVMFTHTDGRAWGEENSMIFIDKVAYITLNAYIDEILPMLK